MWVLNLLAQEFQKEREIFGCLAFSNTVNMAQPRCSLILKEIALHWHKGDRERTIHPCALATKSPQQQQLFYVASLQARMQFLEADG